MGLEMLIVTLLGTASITMILMFLPAAFELFHPKDSGPRLIQDNLDLITIVPIANIEDYQPQAAALPTKVSGLLYGIANLET